MINWLAFLACLFGIAFVIAAFVVAAQRKDNRTLRTRFTRGTLPPVELPATADDLELALDLAVKRCEQLDLRNAWLEYRWQCSTNVVKLMKAQARIPQSNRTRMEVAEIERMP